MKWTIYVLISFCVGLISCGRTSQEYVLSQNDEQIVDNSSIDSALKSESNKIDLKTAEEYVERGILKDEHLDHNGAIEDFNKALELDSTYARAYNNRGI